MVWLLCGVGLLQVSALARLKLMPAIDAIDLVSRYYAIVFVLYFFIKKEI